MNNNKITQNKIRKLERNITLRSMCVVVALLSGLGLSALPTIQAQDAEDSGGGPIKKKLIGVGWGPPSAAEFLEHLPAIEATPFDGVNVSISHQLEDGSEAEGRRMFVALPWNAEWFADDIAALKKIQSTKLTDNFLRTAPGPAPDLFDDKGWEISVQNAAIAARVAKQGGLKGLIFDPESGGKTNPFKSKLQPEKDQHTFAEYAAKARLRGRQVMEAFTKEYPDMVFFTCFLNSGIALGAFGTDPEEGLESTPYSLYPAFMNGMLDVIPPTMKIIDGNEHSYPHSNDFQYLKRFWATRNGVLPLVAKKNRDKYRTQVSSGLALYMDAFIAPLTNPHSSVYTDPPLTGTLAERLKEATAAAQEYSDDYVWVWGERYRWWPTDFRQVRAQSWDDIIPGASAALRDGMNPEIASLLRADKEFADGERRTLVRGLTLKNLIVNGAFTPTPKEQREKKAPVRPEGWQVSLAADSQGVMEHDRYIGYQTRSAGCASLAGVSDGFYSQEVEVAPYKFYKFRVRVRQSGKGEPFARLRWIDASGKPVANQPEIVVAPPTASPLDGWQLEQATVRAPKGAVKLAIELGAKNQINEKDIVWYDSAELYQIKVN